MSIIAASTTDVITERAEAEAAGVQLAAELLAEARHVLSMTEGEPMTPEELAYVVDNATGGELAEEELAFMVDVLAG